MADDLNKHLGQLRELFTKVLNLKESESRKSEEISECRRHATLLFVIIKKVNRMIKYKLRSGRENLHREKLVVDSNRLQLQNLLYEVNHLKREIRHCYQFKSQDEDIDLLSYNEYPDVYRVSETELTSDHEKRLNRLNMELCLRKQLSSDFTNLLKSKKKVFQDIVLKMERLTSFAPSLQTLLQATKPLQDALQVPLSREWHLTQLVHLLPQPLYIAYVNIHSFLLVFKTDMQVMVVGLEEDVNLLEGTKSSVCSSLDKEIGKKDMNELNGSNNADTSEQIKQMLEPHPLFVKLTLGNESNNQECISINIRYFASLRFATASITEHLKETDVPSKELTSIQEMLQYVKDDDFGNTIPVLSTAYLLKTVNMTADECLDVLNQKEFGKPYRWLQQICCIQVYGDEESKLKQNQQLLTTIPEVLKKINNLWSSRVNLLKQIKALVNKNIDWCLKDELLPHTKPSCSLALWTLLTWEEYKSNNFTSHYINSGCVDANNIFYRAVVVRGSAKMECLISVSSNFPTETPLWVISVFWNGQHDSSNNAAIKSLEFWTNSINQSELKNEFALLASQLMRTMYSFDIFLETESPLYNPVEYSKEKYFINSFAKRCRFRPYRYIEYGTSGLFKQLE